eukprot:CAMPEP_0170476818 /NCGR_PEP_ID=MMETSP0123-20130129/18159_1 /TAXON_ID=182087 /ORGANISM="Favella ehrenbergii, Strain Fehren 1" /LENGTH=314 /DNA_ID=CAMNT_0010748089 /DNA_START=652 /DNA_END=1597 /DNA_ORIENTATION=-
MGTILKTKVLRRNSACSSSLTKKSITPFITKEAFDSPGCTRDVRMIDLRTAISTGSDKKLVTMSISTSLPARDLQRTVLRILSLLEPVHVHQQGVHLLEKDKIRKTVLCKSLAGNDVDMLIVTNFLSDPVDIAVRKSIILTSRVHPGESNASFVMNGVIDFLVRLENDFKSEGVVDGAVAVKVVLPTRHARRRRGRRERAEHSRALLVVGSLLARSLIVCDIEAVALPANARLLGLFDGVDQRLHPLVIIGVGLHVVDDIEAVDLVFARVLDAEVEPLRVAVRPVVILQVQVVLKVRYFHRLTQIRRLETTFKE